MKTIYQIKITIGEKGITLSLLFDSIPIIKDVISSIYKIENKSLIFRHAKAALFIDTLEKLGIPTVNKAFYKPSGDCVQLVAENLFQTRQEFKINSCALCGSRPVWKQYKNEKKLFHDCPGEPGSPLVWFDNPQQWDSRNAILKVRYK